MKLCAQEFGKQDACMCYMTKKLKKNKKIEIIETARGPP